MAHLLITNEELEVTDFDIIQRFLRKNGVEFGKFVLNQSLQKFAELPTLTEEERVIAIESVPDVSGRFQEKPGYRADVVCFNSDMPHLQFIIDKFGSIHFHFETEFWYFFDGEAVFGFLTGNGTKYVLTVEAGEYLQVPETVWQWFHLTEAKRMKSIRFFYEEGIAVKREPVLLETI
jgi:1,2-dihydroxy-3-keto-5-methylthiopentene dioxygenase